ncbi:conjugal transfer protein TraA [Sphingopyxis sp. Root214]|uniref:Ti-type conjugative transfer relaxase TraA n=1 Tax=unclassified Sphingopyxis TaxID=2614943 RepID=UPI0006F25E79|nr:MULTISPECIES: Ti-type conjugative transfer relaxase TraA [unclassified Sphingopyxis]KQZ73883.1 conjugal transfer protein TraA [Sphingopyxis sp. Root154]KRC08023.1 conjugal transfer protein TraA [Sphingopyxis sp. Root214]
MAIFHLSVKVISRAAGRSAVAAAAYRTADRLHDERLDRAHDFTNKSGVVHSEVLLPESAPDEWRDRERLWNDVEAFEKRKDAQLSREVEFAIPREMNQAQGIELARDFVQREFVDHGMVADLNVHWDIGADGQAKPHAHVMLTMRQIVVGEDGEAGFGAKVRDWNRTELVEQWRERWADHVNERLAELDIDARVDHRSLEAQGIDLEPQDKIGPAASRMEGRGLEAERIEQHREIAQRNGERIIANPRLALDAITHVQATFTDRDLAMFAHRHSDGREQYDAVTSAVRSSPDLIVLGTDGRGEDRFTSRDMIETEERLQLAADRLAGQLRHGLPAASLQRTTDAAGSVGLVLGREQQAALKHITSGHDLAIVIGYAGTGKSAMLGQARGAWEHAGLEVRGAALSGIAAEALENGSGIASRTIASLEHGWSQGRDLLGPRDVLVIDEAGMVGTRQMERVLSHAADAGAKVVLVGDPQQLQSIEAGAAFRSLHERHGGVEIGEVRRQHEGWQREATRELATGRTGYAIRAYDEAGMVRAAETREVARTELVESWDRDRKRDPNGSRIILTHTNDEVRALNEAARDRMRASGDLGDEVILKVERGDRVFASGDRIMFLRNERSLGVKNGTLGTVERVSEQHMAVSTDDGRRVAFDTKDYRDLDHGYAATIHKAQGMTVDRTHVLATPGMDSHGAYVAMSRHRDGLALHYGRDDFADQGKLVRTLSRERTKDMAGDYARNDPARAFAERRGLTLRERAAEIVRKAPEKARSIFAGFQPTVKRASIEPPGTSRTNDTQRAVERYARAHADIDRMRAKQLPVLRHQREALDKAGTALDACRPHARADLAAAFERQPELVRPAAQGNTQAAVRAMQLEAEIRIDPAKRADRFTENWQRLHQQRASLSRNGEHDAARKVGGQMGTMVKSLERDAQVESILGSRKAALGIDVRSVRPIGRELAEIAGIGRSRSLGIGIGM